MTYRSCRRCLLPALVVLLATWIAGAVVAAPPERDLVYVISDGEQRYGSLTLVVRRLDDGNFEYQTVKHLKVELLGARQEFTTESTVTVAPDLSPLKLETRAVQMSGETALRGRVANGAFIIEAEQDGQTHTSTFALDELVVDLALADWLHAQAPRMEAGAAGGAGASRKIRVLATESGAVSEVTVHLVQGGPEGSTWRTDSSAGFGQTTLRLDSAGTLIDQVIDLPPVRVERSSVEQAKLIDYRRIPDRELLVFPLGRELPSARRLQHVDVRLAWKEIGLEEFDLEDSRQTLRSHTAEDGNHTAVVRLQRPTGPGADAKLPLQDAEFAEALAETHFIRPRDERIAAIAREIAGEETSARAATEAICKWVYEYIQPAMIAETLSGPQVLERRTGKCSEYTTLFASLARAAGVPTRVVLGQRRFHGVDGDTWGGHMWNEVYVGEWIPVDASVNEVGGSTDLLKFIHTDTVMDTQPLRWKLTQSLEISILEFEAMPHVAADGVESGLHEGVYTNVDHGLRLRLPSEAWRVKETATPGTLLVRLVPPDEDLADSALIHLTAFEVPAGAQAKMFVEMRLNHHRSGLADFEVLVDEETQVSGAAGRLVRFRGVPRIENGVPLRVTEVLWTRGQSGGLLNLIATEELHERHLEVFESIVEAVGFIEE